MINGFSLNFMLPSPNIYAVSSNAISSPIFDVAYYYPGWTFQMKSSDLVATTVQFNPVQ